MKKIKTGRRFLIGLTFLVYLILAGVLMWHFWLKPPLPPRMVSSAVTETIKTIQNTLQTEYPSMDIYGVQDWRAEAVDGFANSPALTLPGGTKLKSNVVPGLYWSWTSNDPTADALYKNVAVALVKDGFSQGDQGQQSYTKDGITTIYMGYDFSRGDEHCLFINSGLSSDNFDELRCYDQATINGQNVLIKTYTTAYNTASPKKKLDQIVQVRIASQNKGGVISASEHAGYDIAEVSFRAVGEQKGYIALFYEHMGQWHYVTTATDEYGFSCGDMKADPQARIALHDQICYNYGPAPDDQLGTQRLDSSRHF